MQNKVLIVDDEKSIIKYVMSLLTSLGYNCDFMPNPNYVISKLESGHYDLILLDINMPGIDGISLLKQLKEHEVYKSIPVIMMTGNTDAEILAKCFKAQAADFIVKPINKLILEARVKSIIDKQNHLKEIRRQNFSIHSNLNYAKSIQKALLPQRNEMEALFSDAFIFLQPKDVVSGDFYWFAKKDGKTIIAAVDCTGHGVSGAFMSLVGNTLFNKIVNEYGITDPNKILETLHLEIQKALKQRELNNHDGMDVALCVIDDDKKQLYFSGAKRPLIYIHNNELYYVKGDRTFIGGFLNGMKHTFSTHNIPLDESMSFYLFSDGFTDQFGGEKDKKFSLKQLKDLLLEIHNEPMQQQRRSLRSALEEWKNEEQQVDDILVIGFRV